MSDKKHGLVMQTSLQAVFKETLTNVRVHGRQGVVKEEDVAVAVNCSSQTHSLFLSAAQCYTPLTYLEDGTENCVFPEKIRWNICFALN